MDTLKTEHILMVLIAAFLLYHLMGSCGCSRAGNGFRVGGRSRAGNGFRVGGRSRAGNGFRVGGRSRAGNGFRVGGHNKKFCNQFTKIDGSVDANCVKNGCREYVGKNGVDWECTW